MSDCVKRMVEKSKGALTEADAKQLLKDVDRLAKKATRGGFDREEAIEQVIKERTELVVKNIAKEKANIARNVLVKTKLKAEVNRLIAQGVPIDKALQSLNENVESPVEGIKNSIDLHTDASTTIKLSSVFSKMQKENLVEMFNSGQFNEEIGRAMWSLSRKEKPTVGNKQTQRIAEIWFEAAEMDRLELVKYGADVEPVAGYMMPQRHDMAKIRKVDKDTFANKMAEWADPKRTFGGESDDLFDSMRGTYESMVTGIRLDDAFQDAPKLFQFSGPSNLAKKLSQARKIHFKDYDSWKAWHDEFGGTDFRDGLVDAVAHNQRNIQLLKKYGTNPEAMHKQIVKEILQEHRSALAENPIDGLEDKMQKIMNFAMGKTRHPINPTIDKWTHNIKSFQSVTKLGGMLISSVPGDTFAKTLEYKHQGKTFLSSYADAFKEALYSFKSKEDKMAFANHIEIMAQSFIGDIGDRYSNVDSLLGDSTRNMRLFFKYTGQTGWNDNSIQGVMRTMSYDLARKKSKKFDELDADTKRLFGNYNITSKDWDAIRASAVKLDDGKEYVGNVANADANYKLQTYLIDRSSYAVPRPGAREQRIVTLGTQAGTPEGMAIRLMGQFKTFPLTMATKIWGRELAAKGKADIPAIVHMIIMGTAFGYLAGMAKDAAKGRTPKDPTKPETIFAAMAQGGAFSIWGDVLLSDGTFGSSPVATFAGPTAGTFEQFFRVYSNAKKGEFAEAQAVRTAVGLIPLNNHPLVRPALDHLMLLDIQEQLNPGYLRRMERNLEKTYGQELFYK